MIKPSVSPSDKNVKLQNLAKSIKGAYPKTTVKIVSDRIEILHRTQIDDEIIEVLAERQSLCPIISGFLLMGPNNLTCVRVLPC